MRSLVNEAKLTSLWARNCATNQQVLILKFTFAPETSFTGRAFRETGPWSPWSQWTNSIFTSFFVIWIINTPVLTDCKYLLPLKPAKSFLGLSLWRRFKSNLSHTKRLLSLSTVYVKLTRTINVSSNWFDSLTDQRLESLINSEFYLLIANKRSYSLYCFERSLMTLQSRIKETFGEKKQQ